MATLTEEQLVRLEQISQLEAQLLSRQKSTPPSREQFFQNRQQAKGQPTEQELGNLGLISQNLVALAGPMGALVKGVSDPELQRKNALFTKSAIEAVPFAREFVPREQSKILGRLTPETIGESLIVGATTVAVDLPQILLLEGALAKAFPALLRAPRIARALTTGTSFGAAKAIAEGDIAGAIPRGVTTGATFAAFGVGGQLGGAASKLIPKSLLKSVGPKAARRLLGITSKTGAVVTGAGVGSALSIGAPTEDMVANTLLGGALGALGGKSFRKGPRKPRPKDPTIARIEQLTKEKKQELKRAAIREIEETVIPNKKGKVTEAEKKAISRAEEGMRTADMHDEIAKDLAAVGDFENAKQFSKRAAELREVFKEVTGVRTEVKIAFDKAKRIKEIPDNVLEEIARREATTEVLIKAQEKSIFQGEQELATLIDRAKKSGAAELARFPLLDEPTKLAIVESVTKAQAIKGKDLQTTEFIRIAQELDGGNPGVKFVEGPVTKMFQDVLRGSGLADKNARVVMHGFLRDLKGVGFKVDPKTGKIDKRESRRFRDFVERFNPDKPFTEAEVKKFSEGEKFLRTILDKYYVELNEFLTASGQSFARYVNDYLPWIAEIDASRYLMGDGTATARLSSRFERPEHAAFKFKNPRGKERPNNPIDAIRAVEDYVNRAEIAKGSERAIQEARFRAEAARELKESAGSREDKLRYDTHAKFFDNFADTLTGMTDRHAMDLVLRDHPAGRLISTINSRWIANALTSFGPFINQVLSVPALAGTEVGVRRALGGSVKAAGNEFWGMLIRHVSNPAYETFAAQHSLVYNARLHAGEGRLVGRRTNIVGRFFDSLTGSMDRIMVAGAFNTGYKYARETLGLPHEARVAYGDTLAARTNAVFNRSLKPQILQSRTGNIIAPLNTSIFASMNTMFRDGLFNKELPLNTKVARVGKMLASAVIIRMALEQFRKSPGNVFEDAVLDNIPILGSAARFGGPGIFSTISRFAQGKSPRSKIRGAILLGGPRGSFQLLKTFEGIKATLDDGIVRDKNGKVLFRYDSDDMREILRSAFFSPSGTKAGEEYFDRIFPGIVRGSLRAFDVI